jgi:hypothetical protein
VVIGCLCPSACLSSRQCHSCCRATRRGVTAPPLMQAHAASHMCITSSHRLAYMSPHGPTTPSPLLLHTPEVVVCAIATSCCACYTQKCKLRIFAPCCAYCPLHNAATSMLAVVVHQRRQHGQQLVASNLAAWVASYCETVGIAAHQRVFHPHTPPVAA